MPARPLLLVAAMLAACPAAALARDLTVVARDETMPDALHRMAAPAFAAASGIPLVIQSWNGGTDALNAQLKTPGNTWDVVEVSPDELDAGCTAGLFEKLDWSAIGGKDHYLPQGVSDCGVGATVNTLVLAWDRHKFPAAPTWADFWDVAKYPGKRGLRKGVRGNLEFALMADGVAPGDVYKVLSTSDGVDRAFRKLDHDAAHILSSGDVLMTSAPAGQIVTADKADHRNFGIQWNGGLYEVESWAIVKATPDLWQAEQFLYLAGMPALEGKLLETAGIAGLAKGANGGLPDDVHALSASYAKNLGVSVPTDNGFWHDNLAKLQQRFNAWLAAH